AGALRGRHAGVGGRHGSADRETRGLCGARGDRSAFARAARTRRGTVQGAAHENTAGARSGSPITAQDHRGRAPSTPGSIIMIAPDTVPSWSLLSGSRVIAH